MKFKMLLFMIAGTFGAQAQLSDTISWNNAAGIVNSNGIFFHNAQNDGPGYALPKEELKYLIHSSAFWFSGKDVNGQVKFTGPVFYADSTADLWPGPLVTMTATASLPSPLGQEFWDVSRTEIEDHIQHYQDAGYTVPASIASWPAHGDQSQQYSYYLAPFVDVDGDGNYMPENGDYPCIKGDYAVYTILNDKVNVHGSGGDPIGIEAHFMFYQFEEPELQNITFMDIYLHNRGTQTLYDFTVSYAMDGDLGNPNDDFVGCDTLRNLGYYYNDPVDEDALGMNGYGTAPPAFGVVSLNHTMRSFQTLKQEYLASPVEKYQRMRGYSVSGAPIIDADGNETTFEFYDNPNDAAGWSEITAGSAAGDRTSIQSVDMDVLTPFSLHKLSYAIVFAQGQDNLSSVDRLLDVCDSVQAFYDQYNNECDFLTLSTGELDPGEQLRVYPNPFNDVIRVEFTAAGEQQVEIFDLQGKCVYAGTMKSGKIEIDTRHFDPGTYLLRIVGQSGTRTELMVRR